MADLPAVMLVQNHISIFDWSEVIQIYLQKVTSSKNY